MGTTTRVFAIICFLLFFLNSFCQDGSLKTSFGGGGKTILPVTYPQVGQSVSDMVVQTDGSLILVGGEWSEAGGQATVLKLKSDGSPDSSFNGNGKVGFEQFNKPINNALSVALQKDGKIVVGLSYYFPDQYRDYALVRLLPDGTPDYSFGDGGVVVGSLSLYDDYLKDIAIQSDGKILMTAWVNDIYHSSVMAGISRFNVDGSVDESFGQGGKIINGLTNYTGARPYALALQPDGKILLGGIGMRDSYEGYGEFLFRFDLHGKPDSSFGQNGKVFSVQPWMSAVTTIQVQEDGRILTTGGIYYQSVDYSATLTRYNMDGSLDTGFGTGGRVALPMNNPANQSLLQKDGKILIAGSFKNDAFEATTFDFGLLRYNSDGTIDKTFGENGIARTDFVNLYEEAFGLGLIGNDIFVSGNISIPWIPEDPSRQTIERVGLAVYNNSICDAKPLLQSRPSPVQTCIGNQVSFSVVSSAASQILWQIKRAENWLYIEGAEGATLSLVPQTIDNGASYRAVLTNECGTVISEPALLSISEKISFPEQDYVSHVCPESSYDTLTIQAVTASIEGASVTSHWQYREAGSAEWIDIEATTTSGNTDTITHQYWVIRNQWNRSFRLAVEAEGCTAYSPAAIIQVNKVPTIEPIQSLIVCPGEYLPPISLLGTNATRFRWTNNAANINLATGGTGNQIPGFYPQNFTKQPITATFTVTPINDEKGLQCEGQPITFNLTVKVRPAHYDTVTVSYCDLPYNWNGWNLNYEGTFGTGFSNPDGCDSATYMTLILNRFPKYGYDNVNLCQSGTPYFWNGQIITSAGFYSYHTYTKSGCDSFVTLSAVLNPVISTTETVTVCQSSLPYTWLYGVQYSTAGTYETIVAGANGCPEIRILKLKVSSLSLSTSVRSADCGKNNGTASIEALGIPPYSYNWYTNPVQHTATATGIAAGQYRVDVSDAAGCSSSQWVSVGLGEDRESPVILVSPLQSFCPAAGSFTIPRPTSTDNCSSVHVQYVITGATNRTGDNDATGSFNSGVSTITWTATDEAGNESSAQTIVSVGSSTLQASIPDAYASPAGVQANTVYKGYIPASTLTLQPKVESKGDLSYLWNTGATTASITVSPVLTTTYYVTITDGTGCSVQVSKTVEVIDVGCGNKMDKVSVCKNGIQICLSENAVPAQLKEGAYLGPCYSADNVRISDKKGSTTINEFAVQVLPNPSNASFRIMIKSKDYTTPIQLKLYNAVGQLLDYKLHNSSTFVVGEGYRPGSYYVEVQQGSSRKTIKLIKVKS